MVLVFIGVIIGFIATVGRVDSDCMYHSCPFMSILDSPRPGLFRKSGISNLIWLSGCQVVYVLEETALLLPGTTVVISAFPEPAPTQNRISAFRLQFSLATSEDALFPILKSIHVLFLLYEDAPQLPDGKTSGYHVMIIVHYRIYSVAASKECLSLAP